MRAMLHKRVVVIAGPTAVGKSSLGLRLCEQLQGELISVDSVQAHPPAPCAGLAVAV